MKWVKMGTEVNASGKTVTYEAVDMGYTIESRMRHIPHANREGTWDHTTYFVIKNGEELTELYSLKDAKEYVEKLEASK